MIQTKGLIDLIRTPVVAENGEYNESGISVVREGVEYEYS